MLIQRIAIVTLIAGLVLTICAPRTRLPSLAQALPTTAPAATPGGLSQVAPYPDGIELSALAMAPLDRVPANPATIRLERYTLSPGDRLTGATSGPRLVVVEDGELMVAGSDVPRGTYSPNGSVLIPAEASAELAPAADDPTTFLLFRIDAETTGAATPLADGGSPRVLLTGSPRLPRGEATIAIVSLTVAPGADAGQRVFSGPVGLAIEAGSLTVVDLDGQPTRLEAGGSLIAPAYTAHHLRNDGAEPVRGLAVGILPASPALAGAPVATPTPATDVAATATIAALVQNEADLRATIAALDATDAELRAGLATQEAAASGAITEAQATTAAIGASSVQLSADLATASSRSYVAESTIASLRPTVAALELELGTATAQQVALAATSQAHAIALQTWEGRADSLATNAAVAEQVIGTAQAGMDQAEATISAQAMALQTVVATATAQALQAQAVQATAAAQLTNAENNAETVVAVDTTRAAELAAAQATVTALAVTIATMEAATAPAINPTYREVMIEEDVSAVVGGNPAAEQAILGAVRQELQAEMSQAPSRPGIDLWLRIRRQTRG